MPIAVHNWLACLQCAIEPHNHCRELDAVMIPQFISGALRGLEIAPPRTWLRSHCQQVPEPGPNTTLIPKPGPFPRLCRSSVYLNSSHGKGTMKNLILRKCEHSGSAMFFLAAWHLCTWLQLLLQAVPGKQASISLVDRFELAFLLWAGRDGVGGGVPCSAHGCILCIPWTNSQIPSQAYRLRGSGGSRLNGVPEGFTWGWKFTFRPLPCLCESWEREMNSLRSLLCWEAVVLREIYVSKMELQLRWPA